MLEKRHAVRFCSSWVNAKALDSLSKSAQSFYVYLEGKLDESKTIDIEVPYREVQQRDGLRKLLTWRQAIEELEKKGWILRERKDTKNGPVHFINLTLKYFILE